LNIYLLKIMVIRPRKALLALALVASCNVVLTPNPAAAQTTLPTITVVGSRPQSETEIRNFLDSLKRPYWSDFFENMLPDFLGGGEEITADHSLTLYTVNGCSASQQTRTDAVARDVSSSVNNRSSFYQNGSVFDVRYNDGASERFVVTSMTTSAVVITPIQGSFSTSGCR
jgi:hypothetical protein